MTKKITKLEDYISSQDAATLLSQKLGRPIDPDYIRKLKNVRSHQANGKCKLYHRDDILASNVKEKQRNAKLDS